MNQDFKKFIVKSVLFCCFLFCIVFIVDYTYDKYIYIKLDVNNKNISSLSDNNIIKYAFLGTSHSEYGIYTPVIDDSYNFSIGGSNYHAIYDKINLVLNEKKIKINNMILEIDPHSFMRFMFVNESNYLQNFIKKNFKFIGNGRYFRFLFFENPHLCSDYENGFCKTRYNSISESTDLQKDAIITSYSQFKDEEVASEAFKYLKKIIKLTEENNINLVLVKTPLTKYYFEEAHNRGFDINKLYERLFIEIGNDYKNSLLDYSKIFINNDEYFADSHHLNLSGAKEFTNKLYLDIQNNF